MNAPSGTRGSADSAAKQAAIVQWTADPCGSNYVGGSGGSEDHIAGLIAMRDEYAPWMAEELDYRAYAGSKVLDVGCGQGIDVARYANAGAVVTGVDLTPRHVELAQAHVVSLDLEAEVLLGDAEHLPFADRSFDHISSNGVLHHTPDMPAALTELRRVLRPDGTVTVIVYNRHSFHYWLHQVLVHGLLRGGIIKERGMEGVLSRGVECSSIGARPLVRVYSRRQMRTLLRTAGFVDVSTRVRHFRTSDTVFTRIAERAVPALRDPDVLDRLGTLAGWYVIARGRRS